MSGRYLDEDDVRVRPGPASRPRSRLRPKHSDAVDGVVVTVDRGRFTCLAGGQEIVAMRSGELRRTPVVVGDVVHLVGDLSGKSGSLARIVRVAPRTTLLRRTADDDDPIERPIVANADQLVVVVALADPAPRQRFLDRCLVAAYDGGLDPLLCLTKSDLADPDELLAAYAPLGVPAVVTAPKLPGDPGVSALRACLADRTSVLIGQSGVGKSTLVNLLVPGADRRVGVVTGAGKGRHTSVAAIALALPEGGWIVDTPGVRSFGLGHVTAESLLGAFPDIADGTASPARMSSYQRLCAAPLEDDQSTG